MHRTRAVCARDGKRAHCSPFSIAALNVPPSQAITASPYCADANDRAWQLGRTLWYLRLRYSRSCSGCRSASTRCAHGRASNLVRAAGQGAARRLSELRQLMGAHFKLNILWDGVRGRKVLMILWVTRADAARRDLIMTADCGERKRIQALRITHQRAE